MIPDPAARSSERQSPPKLEALRAHLRELGSVLVCYSGGIDSALLLAVAREQLGPRAVALTAVSPSLADAERVDATRFASELGARHLLVESKEIERPGYVANGPDRCFHCKSELYEIAARECARLGISHVVNGANAEDLTDYRPGLDAARRAGVKSPLLEVGMNKADVREAALALGLRRWDKPASACLSSRIPYGTSVTKERLAQIAGFEAELKALGFRQLRVRWHDTIARVELALNELELAVAPTLRDRIVEAGKRHGFLYVTLDLAGYRQGSHNEVLVGGALRTI